MIDRGEIPDYFSPEFWTTFRWWQDWRILQELPYVGGTRDQPCQWYDTVMMYELMFREHEAEEMKRGQ